MTKIEVPFEGFYQTFLSAAVEAVIDNQLENWGFFDSVGSVEVDRESIAKCWLELYSQQISEALGIDDLMLSFAELISPREYNFQNDRIIANITEAKLANLRDAMQNLYPPEYLQDKAEDLFLSSDGFISFNRELAKPGNWTTLENPFIGLLWLPSANEFEEAMGYDLHQHLADELYYRGSIDESVYFPDIEQSPLVEFEQLAGEIQEQLREEGYSSGDVLFRWGRQILNFSQAYMLGNSDFHGSIPIMGGKGLLVKLLEDEEQILYKEL